MDKLRVGDPLDKASTSAPSSRQCNWSDRAPGRAGRGRRRARFGSRVDAARQRAISIPPRCSPMSQPSSTIAQEEIFGPVLVAMTFRTPDEAVELANNTRYGLAASVWSENINLALDIAPQVKAGTVWVNCTNLFDAACRLRRLSRERLRPRRRTRRACIEYLKPALRRRPRKRSPKAAALQRGDRRARRQRASRRPRSTAPPSSISAASRRGPMRLFAMPSLDASGRAIGAGGPRQPQGHSQRGRGGARRPRGWARPTAHNRAQVLYYIAENLAARADEFAERIARMTGATRGGRAQEVDAVIRAALQLRRLGRQIRRRGPSHPLAQRDAGDERAVRRDRHRLPRRGAAARLVSLVMPAHRHGQRVVWCPRERTRLRPPTSTRCWIPVGRAGGVVNIVTGGAMRSRRRWPSTTRSMRSGMSATGGQAPWSRRRRPAISRRPGSIRPRSRLAATREGRARISAPRHPGEEHLGALRRIKRADYAVNTRFGWNSPRSIAPMAMLRPPIGGVDRVGRGGDASPPRRRPAGRASPAAGRRAG